MFETSKELTMKVYDTNSGAYMGTYGELLPIIREQGNGNEPIEPTAAKFSNTPLMGEETDPKIKIYWMEY